MFPLLCVNVNILASRRHDCFSLSFSCFHIHRTNYCRDGNYERTGSVNLSRNYRIFSSPCTITELHLVSIIVDGNWIVDGKMGVSFVRQLPQATNWLVTPHILFKSNSPCYKMQYLIF